MHNTHILLFKSPRDVQQINVLRKQIGLGNNLRTWYADGSSTPYGHLLIASSPKTNDLLRYCTDVTSFPSEFYLPSSRSRITQINDQKSRLHYSKALSKFQQRIPDNFFNHCSKDFIKFLCECCKNLQGNLEVIENKLYRLKNIIRKLVSKKNIL